MRSDVVKSLLPLEGVQSPSGGSASMLSARHCRRRAQEARVVARLAADPAFRSLLLEIADAYEDIADDRDAATTAVLRPTDPAGL
jgi:hypothetical protein